MCAVLLCVLCLLSAPPGRAAAEDAGASVLPPEYEGYELAAESDRYELYLYEPQISLVLRNKENGSLIASTLNAHTAQG